MSDLNNSYIALNEPFYCRTVMLQRVQKENENALETIARISMYRQAYQTDPLAGLWTVQDVEIKHDGQKMPTYVPKDYKDIPFVDAMKLLAQFENNRTKMTRDDQNEYEIIGQTAEEMEFLHYLAYAEREGLIADETGRLHIRPHELALPENCVIDQKDLQRADERWDSKNLKAQKSPLVAFQVQNLSELFSRAVQPGINPENILNRTVEKRIEVLERFMTHIEQCHKFQQKYVDEFRKLGRAHLIENAEEELVKAREMIVKKTVWGVSSEFKDVEMPYIQAFKDFIDSEAVKLILLHVQAMQTINNEGLFDSRSNIKQSEQLDMNSKEIETRLKKAEGFYKNMGCADQDITNMRYFALNKEPQVSAQLQAVAQDFSSKKEAYKAAAKNGKRLRDDAIIPMLITAQHEKAVKEKSADLENRAKGPSAK